MRSVRSCTICNTNQTTKWFSGPLCRKCYRQQPSVRERELIAMRNYRSLNREKILCKKKEWRQRHSNYDSVRCKHDVEFRLKKRLRTRLWHAMKHDWKTGSAVHDLGCSVAELKIYLESKFEQWMTWENYGPYRKDVKTWNVDHIIPLDAVDLTDCDQLKKVCHFTNLRPLESKKNLIKGNRRDI